MNEQLATAIKVSLCIAILAFYAWCLTWVVRVSRRGGRSPGLAPIRVWLTGPLGLLLWLAFRPPSADDDRA